MQRPQISIIIMAQANNLYLMSYFSPNINQVVLILISKFSTELSGNETKQAYDYMNSKGFID